MAFRCGFWDEAVFDTVNYLNLLDIYGEEENAAGLYFFTEWFEPSFLEVAEKKGATVELFGVYDRCRAYRSDRPLMRVP